MGWCEKMICHLSELSESDNILYRFPWNFQNKCLSLPTRKTISYE